jgi:integrase
MPDFLTRRNGTWHFARRVPIEFARVDPRGVVKHSTRVRIGSDRAGRRAARIAERFNVELERYWNRLSKGNSADNATGYEEARRKARALGFEYHENEQLLEQPAEARLERLEALFSGGLANDQGARVALLGTAQKPPLKVSEIFQEFESISQVEIRDLSPGQLRIWRNTRKRAVEYFLSVVGDLTVNELTIDHAITYSEWWRERVLAGETNAKTANKGMGQLSRMLKDLNIRRRLGLADIFKGLRIKGETRHTRVPFTTDFIQNRLLAEGALDGLNEEARLVLYVVADTGMRPSEVVNLREHSIILDAPIPHAKVLPDERKLKTPDSEREIPLVGAALAALQKCPNGFRRYRDKGSSLSAAVNKYLAENNLRPTKDHTVYSLRHSFKDRLIAAEAPDSLIDNLMGHSTNKPKYGLGAELDLKLKYLQRIAFKPPASL